MATIYSNRNDNAGAHNTVDPNVGTTWAGGAVPLATDQVYIVGRRTQINQAAFSKWTVARTITVDSTANFAASGFFYTVTDRSQILKITYTGKTATTFTGCLLDETDAFYAWDDGGSIADNAYVHNPAYVVEISAGQTFECNELIIQEGGWLFVNGGTLKLNQGVLIRDGRLVGRGAGSIIISRNSAALVNMGYLTAENYAISVVDIDGGEVRTYGELSAPIAKGDGSLTVSNVQNGSFAVGDEIAVYGFNDYRRRNKGYTGYRDASANFRDMDEGFDVVGVSGSTLYLGIRNGARGTVKVVETVGSQKALDVQMDSVYFMAGDKVVIDNAVYTIDKIEDSEVTLYDYDFTDPETSLSDFWVGDPTHIYSGGWEIEAGIGLKCVNAAYREFVHKHLWARDVVVEAEMSPLVNYYSGTRDADDFGILTSYDPAFRFGHRGFDYWKSDYFRVDDANGVVSFNIRSASNYSTNVLSREAAFRTMLQGPCTYRIDNRKMKTLVTINGEELTTEFRRDGNYKGLCGLFVDSNTGFRCKRLTFKAPTQKIYLTTSDSFSVGARACRTGSEIAHATGSRVVKIASINKGIGNHKDLAFAYSGQNGSGEWPQVIQLNGVNTVNSSFPYMQNHDMNVDYYYDLGNASTAKSITIDLGSQKAFTHVSFVPRINDYGTYYGMNGVAVYGSNDLINWTTLYGPTNDTKKWYHGSYNRMAFYPTGAASYRYVKFETKGAQQGTYATNRYVNVGVHNFDGGYKLSVNNASDLSIGDKITVLSDSGYNWGSREYEAYYATVSASSDPETYWHGGWLPECTITGKDGNILTLDKPVFWGYVEDEDSVTVVKTNRNFAISGTMAATGSSNDWRWPNLTTNGGSSSGRIYLFRNLRANYIGSYRYASSTTNNRGWINSSCDYWSAAVLDGVVHMMGPDGTTWVGVGNSSGITVFRNSVNIGQCTAYYIYYATSYVSAAYFNNKILSCINGFYTTIPRAFSMNYNEIASCNTGFSIYDLRIERMTIPFPYEIRRNFIKGISDTGFAMNSESYGPIRGNRIKFIGNKIRGGDDYAVGGNATNGCPHIDCDFMAEHTGSRLSRYRNEGFLTEAAGTSELTYHHMLQNFGRYGYDITHSAYHFFERNQEKPGILRVYNPNGDDFLAMLGIEIEVLDDVAFQVFVSIDYRIPRLARLQDDGNLDGQLRCYSIQNATVLETALGVTPSTAGTGWNTLTHTFTTFSPEESRAAVYLTRDAQNSYIEFRNGTAYVLTDHPEKVRVLVNSFKIDAVWDQYQEQRDMRPLTISGTRSVKLTKVRF